jgi:serine/threonine protein kinase
MFVCPTCGLSAPSPGFCTDHGVPLADGSDDPLLGQVIGSYRLARRLGRGGMGAVYLGAHPGIGSRVAIKVLLPIAAESPALVERFFAEARAVNVIRHESIVNVLDLAILPDGRPYIIMEYLEGAALSAHFASQRPFPLDWLARIALEVLGGLAAAHAAGITHRDLKPDNVFVTTLGRAKVLDFGVAKLRPEQGGLADGTRTGALLGTPHYMSPEQALGQPVDPRSDLYSLGVILYEGATGRLPFDAGSLYELFHHHVNTPPAPPRTLRPDLPPAFEQLILTALAKRPEHRYQDARQLADALAPILRELPETVWAPASDSGGIPLPTPALTRPASFAPSSSGVAATLAQAPEAPRRSNALVLAVGAGAVLIGLLALGVGVTALVWNRRAPAAATTASAAPSASPTSSPKGPVIDVIGHLSKATAEAQKLMPDATLYSLSVSGPERDGSLDLGDMTHSVGYTFRSPKASQGKGPKKCLVSVSVSKYGTFAYAVEDKTCDEPLLAAPRCKFERILRNTDKSQTLMSVTLQATNGGTQQWIVMTRDGGVQVVPDDC